MNTRKLAIYIHIPFCVRKCLYCDFVSGAYGEDVKSSYVNKLLWEIEEFFSELQNGSGTGAWAENADSDGDLESEKPEITSVFFGGGTPSILPPEEIERILCKLKEYAVFADPEITIEVNPGTTGKPEFEKNEDGAGVFDQYKKMGINRISIGMQSSMEEELKTLGRIHTYEEFLSTLRCAKSAGFTNISADIMYAIPGQKYDSFEETLRKTAGLDLTHISAYSLIVEEGTPFYDMKLELPSEEEERRMYRGAAKILAEYGYKQYEISNYALPGYECRHNIAYWTRKEYAGFGVAAASLIGNSRYTNTKSIDEYLGVSDYESLKKLRTDVEELSIDDCMSETVILGLRMNRGVSDKDFYETYGKHLKDVYPDEIEKHKKEGLLSESEDGSISLTKRGRDLSNYVMADFM